MANDHPFQSLFETFGRPSPFLAESVNRGAFETLVETLAQPVERQGRCILLRAPRAGHGKTHLLSRVQNVLGATHEFIPLLPALGTRISALSVMADVLRRLMRPLPAAGGLCVLDLVARRLFASALQPLVASGEVPCQDREAALAALRLRPIETFDFHHANAATALWARENFDVLGQRLSLELADRCHLPVRDISFWVETLFHFAASSVENSSRLAMLMEAAQEGAADEGLAMDRLAALLSLLTQLTRVVLVADELEGFSADETAALRLVAFLGSLRQAVERLEVIFSVNVDVWESAFLPRLSDGLADRLAEVLIELEPLKPEEMAALLESRVSGLGSRVLEQVDASQAGNYARGLVRAAGVAWKNASARESKAVPPPLSPLVEIPLNTFNPSAAIAAHQELTETLAAPEFSPSPDPAPAIEVVYESPFSIALPEVVSLRQVTEPEAVVTQEAPLEIAIPNADAVANPAPVAQNGLPAPHDADRVDELLRQFRDRYGRGSL